MTSAIYAKSEGSSKAMLWGGWILTALPTLFLLMDGVMKLFKPQIVVETMHTLGYPDAVSVPLGIVLIVCTVLYAIPRTAALGAILLTGYLGGAISTHVRVGDGAFSLIFAAAIGVMVWGGLWLRDKRIRALLPVHTGNLPSFRHPSA